MTVHTAALEREIAEEKDALGENLAALEHQAKELVDWRAHVRKSPLAMMGVAFGGGLLVAAMTGSGRSRGSTRSSSARTWREHRPDTGANGEPSAAHDAWQMFKGALISAATTRLTSEVSKLLPGFHEHFEEQRQERTTSRRNGRSHFAGPAPTESGSEP